MRAHPGCAQRGGKAGQCSSRSQGAGRPQALCPHKRTCWHRVKSGRSEGEAFGGDQPVNETSAFPKGPQGAWPPPPRRGQEPWWAAGTGAEGEHWPLPCHVTSTARTEAQARSPGQARVRRESRPPEASLWMKSEGQPPRDQERAGRRSPGRRGRRRNAVLAQSIPEAQFPQREHWPRRRNRRGGSRHRRAALRDALSLLRPGMKGHRARSRTKANETHAAGPAAVTTGDVLLR